MECPYSLPVHISCTQQGGEALRDLRLVHTTLQEFQNGFHSIKTETHQIFSVYTTPEEFKNAPITGQFGFVFEETSVREIT